MPTYTPNAEGFCLSPENLRTELQDFARWQDQRFSLRDWAFLRPQNRFATVQEYKTFRAHQITIYRDFLSLWNARPRFIRPQNSFAKNSRQWDLEIWLNFARPLFFQEPFTTPSHTRTFLSSFQKLQNKWQTMSFHTILLHNIAFHLRIVH